MLGVLAKVAASQPQPLTSTAGTSGEYLEPLFDQYVRQVLAESPRVADPASDQFGETTTRYWLARLAAQLHARELTAFYPGWLQADWLPKRWQALLLIEGIRLVPAVVLAAAAWIASGNPLYDHVLVGLTTLFVFSGLILILASPEPILLIQPKKPAWHWHTGRGIYIFYLGLVVFQVWLVAHALEVLSRPLPSPTGTGILIAAALALPAGIFIALGLGADDGIVKRSPVRSVRPGVVRITYAAGVAAGYAALYLGAAGVLYISFYSSSGQMIRASGISTREFSQAAFVVLAIAAPFLLWNVVTRHLVRRRILRVLLTAQGLLPRHLDAFLNYARIHMLLHHVGDGYLFAHPLLLRYFARQDNGVNPPTPLPTRTHSRHVGIWVAFAGIALLAIDLTVGHIWRSAWKGALGLIIILVISIIMPRMPSGGYIAAKITIPSPGTWKVPELEKEVVEPAPYIIANAQRAMRIALYDGRINTRLAAENSRLIDSITALAGLRVPGLSREQTRSIIAEGVARGAYLAHEDSRPARIPTLTRTLILKEGALAGGEQADIAIYAAYTAYRMACTSALGRYLFLRRIAKVERTERALTAIRSRSSL